MKFCFVDCETTGLEEKLNDVIELYAEIDGAVFHEYARPGRPENVSPEALACNGFTLEQIMGFQPQEEMFAKLIAYLEMNIGHPRHPNKAIFVAFNADFDTRFVRELFERFSPVSQQNPKFKDFNYGNYFHQTHLCIRQRYMWSVINGYFPLPEKTKLVLLCAAHGITYDAHKASEDVRAMKMLLKVIMEKEQCKSSILNL